MKRGDRVILVRSTRYIKLLDDSNENEGLYIGENEISDYDDDTDTETDVTAHGVVFGTRSEESDCEDNDGIRFTPVFDGDIQVLPPFKPGDRVVIVNRFYVETIDDEWRPYRGKAGREKNVGTIVKQASTLVYRLKMDFPVAAGKTVRSDPEHKNQYLDVPSYCFLMDHSDETLEAAQPVMDRISVCERCRKAMAIIKGLCVACAALAIDAGKPSMIPIEKQTVIEEKTETSRLLKLAPRLSPKKAHSR